MEKLVRINVLGGVAEPISIPAGVVVIIEDHDNKESGRYTCAHFLKNPESGAPPDPQHGRGPDKVKPLAQYLAKEIAYNIYGHDGNRWGTTKWRELLEQALDAYESTEQVKIRIERV